MFNIFTTYEVAVLIWYFTSRLKVNHKTRDFLKSFENASSVASVFTIWEEYKPSRVIFCIEFWSRRYV